MTSNRMKHRMIVLQIAAFPMFAAAIVWLVRHFIRDKGKIKLATLWASIPALCAVLSMVLAAGFPRNFGTAATFSVSVFLSLLLACVLWIAIYSGMLLGERQGGYWSKFKSAEQIRAAVPWCIGATAFATGLSYGASSIFHLSVPHFGSGRFVLAATLTKIAYSFAEEFVYRGCFQALLGFWLASVKHGELLAIGIAAVLFTAQHVNQNHQLHVFLVVLPAGLTFGAIFARCGILAAAAVHLVSNLLILFLLPWIL